MKIGMIALTSDVHGSLPVPPAVAGLGEALLSRPLGNHPIIVPGHHRSGLEAVLSLGGSVPVAVEPAQG